MKKKLRKTFLLLLSGTVLGVGTPFVVANAKEYPKEGPHRVTDCVLVTIEGGNMQSVRASRCVWKYGREVEVRPNDGAGELTVFGTFNSECKSLIYSDSPRQYRVFMII